MASSLPPVKGAAFTFDISLISQADTDIFKTSCTLAAGDITISKDGGSFSNITTLPTEIGTSGVLPIALSATEMNADRVTVRFHDAAGDEWQDALVTIYTAGQTLDTTDGIADDIKATVNHADYGNAKLVRSTTPANTLDVSAAGEADANVVNWKGSAAPAMTGDAYARLGAPAGASVSADVAAVKTQTAAIEADTQDLQTQIGTDGAGLTAIGDARLANLDATVSSRHAAGAAVAKSPATLAAADVSGNLPVDVQTIKTQAVTAAAGVTFPASIGTSTHSAADVKTALEADGSKLDHVWEMTEDDGGVRRLTTNALEQAPGTSLDAQAVADALSLAPTGAAAAGSVYAELDAILADTDELQTDWTDGGRLDLLLDAAGGAADPLLNAVPGAYAAGTAGNALGSIDDIKAKTDLITTGTALTVVSAVDGSTITATIAASLAATLTGLTISADWAKVYLTVKRHTSDTDAQSLLQVVVSNPAAAATDGTLYVNGAAASVAQRTQAAITVTQATGVIAIALDEALTGALREGFGLAYDLKELTTSGAANVLAQGTWNWVYTATWAVT